MTPRTHDQKWLIANALFGCRNQGCAEEHSYPASELAVAPDGEPTCQNCWEEDGKEGDPEFSDLIEFNPFGEAP